MRFLPFHLDEICIGRARVMGINLSFWFWFWFLFCYQVQASLMHVSLYRPSQQVSRQELSLLESGSKQILCVVPLGRFSSWPGTFHGQWTSCCSWCWDPVPEQPWCATVPGEHSPPHAACTADCPQCWWFHQPLQPTCRWWMGKKIQRVKSDIKFI